MSLRNGVSYARNVDGLFCVNVYAMGFGRGLADMNERGTRH